MIRVIVFLAAAGFIALGAVWLADRPGQVAITWLGYRADLSVMVAAMAILTVAVLAIILWSLSRFLLRRLAIADALPVLRTSMLAALCAHRCDLL